MTIDAIMRTAPVIPVLVIDDAADARPIAEALVAGGLTVLEVTLRTPTGLDVIREMAKVDGAIVGAGTVIDEASLDLAINVGAKFIVSPGLTERFAHAAIERGIPYLPGVATASDILRGIELGLDRFKFFPAEGAGGIKALRSLAGPFGSIRFCPTGGITAATAREWLAEEAVLCVGGSWVVKRGAVDAQAITTAAREAAALR